MCGVIQMKSGKNLSPCLHVSYSCFSSLPLDALHLLGVSTFCLEVNGHRCHVTFYSSADSSSLVPPFLGAETHFEAAASIPSFSL